MTNSCGHCGKEHAACSFLCTDCPANEGQTTRFCVCNRTCQVKIWKAHKKTHGKTSAGKRPGRKPDKAEEVTHVETMFGNLTMRTCSKDDMMESLNNSRSWFHQLGTVQAPEWLVDCYRMRADDDVQWGSFNFHGLYEIAEGVPGEAVKPLTSNDKAFIMVQDFLVFLKLAIRNEVMPERLQDFNFDLCLGKFAPLLLPYPFDKAAAKDKWGSENVFSSRPSLRRTAERVYGLSCK